ncbi:leucine-rich repeat domain-containing protein [Porphyromonas asaccharolytica]|uniref:leucine-rich repeat domain-containing protein n=1 Tax=Porphyromonas asaccharolytica TaxID=28123 RepID=UPI00248D8450|nr:leucine-rich repeat domain-containing protein [Porphyromonas asaccharolytica]
MKRLLLLPVLFLSILTSMAQEATVRLLIKPDATEVTFVYRLAQQGATAQIDLGGGETATLAQPEAEKLQTFKHTFAEPSSTQRTITISADQLVTLRFTSSKAICGVTQIAAPLLERFNCDFTPLMESEELDFSACPKLEEITLNGAEVSRVILPPNRGLLKTFQWATPLLPGSDSRQLKELDLSGCTALESLSLQGTTLRSIDLTDTPLLKQLVITGLSNKAYPRQLIGGKALTHLEMVTLQFCAFTYDMLPDLNETPLDNFKVSKMYYAHVDRSQYRDMTVDLSNMASAKGIAQAPTPTTFTWFYKDAANKWQPIPTDKVVAGDKPGVYTIDESLLDPTTHQITVRAKLFNAGYPDLAFYKGGLHTYNITLPYKPTTMTLSVTTESPGQDEDGYDIDEIDLSLQIAAAKAQTKVQIDWGSGQLSDYTIPKANEPFTVPQTVDLGAKIKLYGPVTLVDATGSKIVGVAFEDAETIETLRLSRNKIEQIDLSRLPNLKELQVSDNKLSELSLSATPKLEELYCGYNKLTQLHVEQTPLLSVLNCNDNQISALALASLPKLEIAVLSGNAFGESLDLSANEKLRVLDIENCQLTKVKLESEYLERIKANDNKLTELQLIPYAGLALNLHSLDVRGNSFTACDLNDLLIQLPSAGDTNEGLYRVQLSGTPGATTYDKVLLNGWIADSESTSEGCETAKIFDASTKPHGHAYIAVGDKKFNFADPIRRSVGGSIVLVPDEGYIPDYCKWGSTTKLTAEDKAGTIYFFVLSNNIFVSYAFKKDTGVAPVTDRPNVWVITPTATGWDIETPYSQTSYELYDLAGQLRAHGVTDQTGRLSCELPAGSYILSIAGATIKLIR